MTRAFRLSTVLAAAATAAVFAAACTVSRTDVPSLAGPSEFGLSFNLAATPDSIAQDGGSQSVVRLSAFDAAGKPLAGQAFHLELVGTVPNPGTLSASTVATLSDGRATVVYTAPPCDVYCQAGTPVGNVNVQAISIGSNYITNHAESVTIRVVPPGVIVPPGTTPTAKFTFSPASPSVGTTTTFDASASIAGVTGSQIVSYNWDFGDGSVGAGKIATHAFSSARSYTVTLTVTNELGLASSTTQTVPVTAPTAPTAAFVFSPTGPTAGATVLFNAETSKAATGHQIVQFSWHFGDPNSTAGNPNTASGFEASHTFSTAGAYVVVLEVLDDTGQGAVTTQTVTVAP